MKLYILLSLSVIVLVTGYRRPKEYWTKCLRLDSVDESSVCDHGYRAIAKAKKVGVMLTCHPVRRQFFCSKRYTKAYWAGRSIHLKVKKKRALSSRWCLSIPGIYVSLFFFIHSLFACSQPIQSWMGNFLN